MRDQVRGKATGGRGRGVSQGGGGVPPPSGLMAGGPGKITRPKQRPFLRREVVGIEILIFVRNRTENYNMPRHEKYEDVD